MTINRLNADYGIDDQLTFSEGKGGFPVISIKNGKATAQVSLYGGQVISYKPTNEQEDLMFLSPKAYFTEGKAIKGGVPVCWPWFGPDPERKGRPNHGFVRNRLWNVASTSTTQSGETLVVLKLSDTEETQALWPYSFELAIEISIGDTLAIALVTRNLGNQSFPVTQALHTYFTVGDINKVTVLGLEGKSYIDKVDGGVEKVQDGAVAIAEEVDRIYKDVPSDLMIDDIALERKIQIKSTGNKTAVVWNPWVDISAKSKDLEDDSYQGFICVETTNAADDIVEVSPGSEFRLTVTCSVNR